MRLFLLSLTAPMLLAACSTTENRADRPKGAERYADDPRLGAPVDRICFASTIDGFGETTRDTVIVREGRDHYLIETFAACTPLDDAMQIGFDGTGGCLSKGDRLIVSSSFFPVRENHPFETQKCLVKAIYKWDKDATDEPATESSGDSEES